MRIAAPTALALSLTTALAFIAGAAPAQEARAVYDVRLLGLPVGKMQLAAREDGDAYAVTSAFATTGVGRIVDAGFRLSAKGRSAKGHLAPSAYDEQIDTGSRRSTAQLRYKDGTPRITGGSVAAEVANDADALDPAAQTGTVDPLTGLYGVMRDRPGEGLCRYSVVIFDGQRRASLAMTARREADGRVTCIGVYTRLAGFSASEMKRQTVYPFSVTYAPQGALMQAQALSVRSSYGTAEMIRE
ncbi:DUF3108 domain-containing protein [Roseovarius sp. Pro17]|uniref:DUF3108 domain-containing protein n=1 Tax=Roseovarius sp. Pro17 TaxID=3108175 RepID=UPI002D7825E0|nr:DUF3108 domain-containing protein [Roseovarius sp. Pro17]